MGILISALTRREALELLDHPVLDCAELQDSLCDLERLNRWFGGASAVIRTLRRLPLSTSSPLTVLDAGTGGADVPRALVRWARKRSLAIEVLAIDRHTQVLAAAAERSRDYPEIRWLLADVLDLPLAPGSVDITICSLALHHLRPPEAVALLRRLREVSRLGFIVTDLERGRLAWAATWLATHLVSRNRLTRNDGPLSVLRAYTLEELRHLAHLAGCRDFGCRRRLPFRLALCAITNSTNLQISQ